MSPPTEAQLTRWEDMPREDLAEGVARRYVTGAMSTVAQILLAKGALVPKHRHDNEQISTTISGKLEFRLGEDLEDVRIVHPGETLVIPPDVPHEVTALEDTVALDFFTPPRQDWIDGTDSYFRDPGSGRGAKD